MLGFRVHCGRVALSSYFLFREETSLVVISGSESSLFATGTEAGQTAEPRIHKMNKRHPLQGGLPHHRAVCMCVYLCVRERERRRKRKRKRGTPLLLGYKAERNGCRKWQSTSCWVGDALQSRWLSLA